MSKALRFDAVQKIYAGAAPVRALAGVSFALESGAFVVVEGPSGSGKTTLLALAGGLDRPTAGRVYALGWDLGTLSERALVHFRRAEVGFVFQDFKLIDVLNATENVAVALQLRGWRRKRARAKSVEALERLGLGERSAALPAELSGGEKQRVAIARALIAEPRLILADEPTANLDWSIGAEVMEILRALARERRVTAVVVSHDPRVAEYADQIVHLRDGRMASAQAMEVVG